jgi:maleate isomerase
VQRHLVDEADAVYLAGNGFRTADSIDTLRRRTGRVVVSANQALLHAVVSDRQ